jgi:nucleotide-binding universal stress UspA family protein
VDEAGLEATVSVVEGNPAEGVRKAVAEREGDLLVVGRGVSQKTVGRFWSNLYAIIRESPCPVLSV